MSDCHSIKLTGENIQNNKLDGHENKQLGNLVAGRSKNYVFRIVNKSSCFKLKSMTSSVYKMIKYFLKNIAVNVEIFLV